MLVKLCNSNLLNLWNIFKPYAFVFCESIPGLSDRVLRLSSMVQISAGSFISISVTRNLIEVLSLAFQLTFNLKVLSSFLEVSDLFRYTFFLKPFE